MKELQGTISNNPKVNCQKTVIYFINLFIVTLYYLQVSRIRKYDFYFVIEAVVYTKQLYLQLVLAFGGRTRLHF